MYPNRIHVKCYIYLHVTRILVDFYGIFWCRYNISVPWILWVWNIYLPVTINLSQMQVPGKPVAVNFHELYHLKPATVALKNGTFLGFPGMYIHLKLKPIVLGISSLVPWPLSISEWQDHKTDEKGKSNAAQLLTNWNITYRNGSCNTKMCLETWG